MSHQSTHHHHSLLNSIPTTHHQPNLIPTIKPENDSDDDDVVFLSSVPKIPHTPENYDPSCQCSTCQLVRRLLAECTCEQCKGTGQHSSEYVPIANAVSPTNGQPSSSSIQNNDASTSEHTNANDQDDYDHSRSSTPDYLPRFFDDESGDSSSDDSEGDANHNMQIDSYDDEDDVKSESEENNDNNDSDYTFRVSSSDDNEDDDSVDDNDSVDSNFDQQSDPEYILSRSITSKSLKKCKRFTKNIKTIDGATLVTSNQATDDESNSREIESDENDKSFVCPKCESSFDEKWKLLRHYRAIHLEWKPFYCKWPKCDFVHGIHDNVARHVSMKHFNMKNRKKGRKYVGKREWSSSSQEDPIYESILGCTSFNLNCTKCGRNFTHVGNLRLHLGSHKKIGFRCTWLQCGFFFVDYSLAKQHILKEHFKGKMINSTEISEHLVKVDPKLFNYNRHQNNNDASTSEQHINGNDQDDDRKRSASGQQGQSSENVPIANAVSPTNGQPSSSSIQNNDASTSEHTNANDLDDGQKSRSSTPDYLPRFFDDESGDSESDSESDRSVKSGVGKVDKELDQESESNDANNSSDPDYAFDDNENYYSVDDGDDGELDQEDENDDDSDSNYIFPKPIKSKSLKISHTKRSSEQTKTIDSKKRHKCRLCNKYFSTKSSLAHHDRLIHQQLKNSFDCPKCKLSFNIRGNLLKHYRSIHQEWKPYYCMWPKCDFVGALVDSVVNHADRKHVENRKKAKSFVGIRKMSSSPPIDPIYESLLRNTIFNIKCPKCSRNFNDRGNFKSHFRTHMKSGFRCTWRQCGFFFSNKKLAKKHLRMEHFIGKVMNSTQINELLVEVDPKTSRIKSRTAEICTDNEEGSNDDDGETMRGKTNYK